MAVLPDSEGEGHRRRHCSDPLQALFVREDAQHVASTTLPTADFLAGIHRFQDTLRDLLDPFTVRPPVPVRRRRKWRKYMPNLARTCADTMELFAPLFLHLPFRSHDLRALEREVFQLEQFLGFLRQATKTVARLLSLRKAELGERTMEVVDQVRALHQMPALPDEDQDMPRHALAQIEGILAPNRAAVREKRQIKANTQARFQAQVDALQAQIHAVELEHKVLRGGSLSAADLEGRKA